MLVEVLPLCLGQPKNKRHRCQEKMLEGVQKTLERVEENLKAAVEKETAAVADANKQAEPSDKQIREMESKLQTDTSQFHAETNDLAQVTLAFRSARTVLETAKETKITVATESEKAADQSAELQALVNNIFTPLKLKEVPDSELDAQRDALEEALKNMDVSFDEVILNMLRHALGKEPCARGEFETLALDRVEEKLNTRLQQARTIVDETDERNTKCTAALDQSGAALEEATKSQVQRAQTFECAWNEMKASEKGLTDAKHAAKSLLVRIKHCEKAKYQAEADLEGFQGCTRAEFDTLRERSTQEAEAAMAEVAA
jgi:hypothetical protein